MNQDKPQRGFLWNTSLYLASTIFSVAVNLVVLPVYTRHLSPSDYGIVALFIMFGNLSVGVVSMNLHFSSFRYYFQFKKEMERFKIIYSANFVFLVIVFLIAGAVIYLFSGSISWFLFKGRLPENLILLSFISGCLDYFILYMLTVLAAQVKSAPYALITITRVIINTAFAFYFIFAHSLTYLALIYSTLLAQVITIAALSFAMRDLFGFHFSTTDLKMSLRLAFPLLPNSMIGLVYGSFDKTMLSHLKNTDSIGFYSFGEKFSMILKFVQDAVSKSWDPFFMNRAHENSKQDQAAIVSRFYEIAFFFMIVGLGIIYYSEEMIKLLTTKAFYPSMFVVPVYVYCYLFAIMGTLSMNQITFSKRMAYVLPTTIGAVIVNIVLNIFLIPHYGAVGAAGAIAGSALFSNLLNLFFGMKLYPLPLGKWKLARLYLILAAFTAPIYPIMIMPTAIIVKMILKFALVIFFIFVGIESHYISRTRVHYVVGKIKGTIKNFAV